MSEANDTIELIENELNSSLVNSLSLSARDDDDDEDEDEDEDEEDGA